MQQCQTPNQHQNEHWASSVSFPGSRSASQTTLLAPVRQKCPLKRVKKRGGMWDFSLEPGRVHLQCPDMVTATQTHKQRHSVNLQEKWLRYLAMESPNQTLTVTLKNEINIQYKNHQKYIRCYFFNWEGRLTSFHWMHVYTDQCQLLFISYF